MTSDILSAERLAAIGQRAEDFPAGCSEDAMSVADDRGALLRHLRALTGSADGEVLGRELYMAIHGHATGRIFDTLPYEARDRMNAAALALYQRGYAAGIAKGFV